MAKNQIQHGLYYGIDKYTKEEELYAAIPNTANGNCLFESLAYFRDDPSIGLEDYAAILRSDLCEAYQKINKENMKKDFGYAYQEINKENMKKDFGYAYQLNKVDLEKNESIKNHWKNICTDKVWAYNSDLTLLSFLMKKVIKLYIRKNNAIDNIDIYPNPNMDSEYKLPDDHSKWNTIQILFSTLDGDQYRGHFEALVLLTADNEEKQIEKIFEEKQKIVSEIDNRGEGDKLTPGEKDDILQLSKEEWEKTKPFIIKENSNVIENMIEVAKNTKKKPQVVKRNTSDKKVEKIYQTRANEFIELQANYYNQMIQDKRTEIKNAAKAEKDAAKEKKAKAKTKKAETKTKKAETKSKETKEEDNANDGIARINEKIKQTYDVKEKKNTPKNTTRKTITNATPKERERLAIEYTLESEIGNKPKVIVVKPRKTRKLFGNKTIKKIKYKNGDMYIGEVKNNKKHGKGKYIFANGEIYIGEYNNGKRV
jgi:hypothetical protein